VVWRIWIISNYSLVVYRNIEVVIQTKQEVICEAHKR
jgi:hypothetical protein